jgi:hypothetical protein
MNPHRFMAAMLLVAIPALSQVTLPNGTVVPKSRFIVYIMIGHSNMVGRTPELDTTVHPRAWNFFITDCYQDLPNHQWVPARDCIHMDMGLSFGGPVMHFLKKMVAAYPDYYFGVVENANSGVMCKANYTKGNGAGALDLFGEMASALDCIKNNVTFGGLVCMLGLGEAQVSESISREFSDDIAVMVQQFRDTIGAPTPPFLIGGFERGREPEESVLCPYWPIIDSQTTLIPQKVLKSAIIPSDSLTYLDMWHYTWESYEIWTQRAVDIIAAQGWFPFETSENRNSPRITLFQPAPAADIVRPILCDALGRSVMRLDPKRALSYDEGPVRGRI